MNPKTKGNLKQLAEFCFFGAIAGIVFQLINEKQVNFMAFIIGIPLGAAFGIIELFIFSGLRKKFLRYPLLSTIFIKALLYVLFINVILGLLGLIFGQFREGNRIEDFLNLMLTREQLIIIIYSLILYVLFAFYTQINLLLGEGVLWKFLLGKYRNPTKEHRIFMFLDLKSSTTIAEKLSPQKYYSFLNDLFHEISDPVRATNAEIYQYVGDEVILTWRTKEGLSNANCLKTFFLIKDKLKNNKEYYLEKYGEVPFFKAGIHFGQVISAQIGDIKREIVYNGDVLNTSARIQGQCNTYQRDILISGILLKQLDLKNEYREEMIDTVKLRGKESDIELYSLIKLSDQNVN